MSFTTVFIVCYCLKLKNFFFFKNNRFLFLIIVFNSKVYAVNELSLIWVNILFIKNKIWSVIY